MFINLIIKLNCAYYSFFRLSSCIKYLNSVVHHQRTIGGSLDFPMRQYLSHNIPMQDELQTHLKIFLHLLGHW
jgi:hypothetical protein